MRALSISSRAMLLKKDRITRMLNTLTALGRISAQYWSYPPRADTTRNSGITPPLKNIVNIIVSRIARCPNDPALDSP